MIKYLGSKRALLPWILGAFQGLARHGGRVRTVADPFSGSARVAHALKGAGFYVLAGDMNAYAYVLARALVEADARQYPKERVAPILEELSALPPQAGWFTRTYAEEARFFRPENAARIEAIRQAIEDRHGGDPTLKAVLLASLLLGADRVDSTLGVQMAYLKRWAPRAFRPLSLEYPPLLPGGGEAFWGDALEWVEGLEADAAYLDPPYNGHSYLGNYHVWETLVLWDAPPTYGKARKRIDCRTRKSPFNSRRQAKAALARLLRGLRTRHVVLSYSDEGFLSPEEVEGLLREWGYVLRGSRPHRRYVGAIVGIHNPEGKRVGRVSHTRNREMLFVATQDRRVHEGLAGEMGLEALPKVFAVG